MTIDFTFDTASNYEQISPTLTDIAGGLATLVGPAYSTADPLIKMNTRFFADTITAFTETSTKAGSDEIKYQIIVNYTPYYYNGADVVVSDGTYAQSNTASEWNAIFPLDLSTIAPSGTVYYGIQFMLHSDDGTTTPTLENFELGFTTDAVSVPTIDTCTVYFDIFQPDSSPDDNTIHIKLDQRIVKYKTDLIVRSTEESFSITPDATGRATQALIETVNMELAHLGAEQTYTVTFGGASYKINVPNQATANFWDIVIE